MDQERAYLLLAKHIAGEATDEEREELEWLLLAHPELRSLAELLPDVQRTAPKGVSSEDEEEMMQRGLDRILQPVRALPVVRRLNEVEATTPAPAVRKRLFPWMVAASLLLLMVGLGVWLRVRKGDVAEKAAPVAMLSTGRGARKSARLPDGSQIWLNAGSRIVLAHPFSHDQRELTLEGEAFFDVKHDEQHPFIIHTGAMEVRVLGTTLNVRAYPGEASMEATLIEGKAEIGLAGNPQSAILLHPNEKVVIPNEAAAPHLVLADSSRDASIPLRYVRRPIVPDQTDGTIAETSWTQNKLVFRNETLAGMSTQLERWYNVTIVFDDKRFQQDTISGTFPDMRIEDVIHALQITSGFKYKIERDTVHIW